MYVYLMKFSDSTFKVGVSADPLKRLRRLKECEGFKKTLEGIEYFYVGSRSVALDIERTILRNNSEFRVEPQVKFNGYSEFLSMGNHYQDILQELDSFRCDEVDYYFNPFVTCDTPLEKLPKEVKSIIKSNFKINYFTKEGKTSVKMFLGNLILFKGKRFVCPQPKRKGSWLQKLNTLNSSLSNEDVECIYRSLNLSSVSHKFTNKSFKTHRTLYDRHYLHFGMGFPWFMAAIENCPDNEYKDKMLSYLDSITKEK